MRLRVPARTTSPSFTRTWNVLTAHRLWHTAFDFLRRCHVGCAVHTTPSEMLVSREDAKGAKKKGRFMPGNPGKSRA